MSALTNLSITEALAGLDAKKFTSAELTEAHIAALAKARGLNAFIEETPDLARRQAKESDARRAAGKAGPMDGIPVAIKDLFCTKGVRTTAASHILDNFVPTYESTVTQKLFDGGCVIDEFAMGSSNMTSTFGPALNPWTGPDPANANRKLVPGGSSGGSAAAIAARIAMGATGTDTGGSILQPASFTGTVGIKPTYGRCSRWGIVAFASSLDQAGPMTRTVADAALMLRTMAGYDPKDSTSVDKPVPDYTAALGGSIRACASASPGNIVWTAFRPRSMRSGRKAPRC
jgi:aspartyl-tRNA(Asn)/glutamyl-tRNA(Gln) amidotransferase subunit A